MACSQTGSGKTAAFGFPMLQNILNEGIVNNEDSSIEKPQGLVLVPTRELAIQIFNEFRLYSFNTPVKCGIAYGWTEQNLQVLQKLKGKPYFFDKVKLTGVKFMVKWNLFLQLLTKIKFSR